jgi:hypothetical protein
MAAGVSLTPAQCFSLPREAAERNQTHAIDYHCAGCTMI